MEKTQGGKQETFQGWPLMPALWIGPDTDYPDGTPKPWSPIMGEQGKAAIANFAGWRVFFLREGEKDPIEGKLSDVLFLPEDCEGHYAMEVRSFDHARTAEPSSKSWQLASSFHQGRVRAGLGAMFHATMGAERVEWSVYRYQGLEPLEIEKGVGMFFVEGPYRGHQDD